MNSWIFQGNQNTFDVSQYIESYDYVYWSVRHKSHQEKKTIGDNVFIWRARGRSQAMPGVIAFGTIAETCKPKSLVRHPESIAEYLWSDISDEVSEIKAGVQLHEVRLTKEDGMLTLYQIRTNPELTKMQIVKVGCAPVGALDSPSLS